MTLPMVMLALEICVPHIGLKTNGTGTSSHLLVTRTAGVVMFLSFVGSSSSAGAKRGITAMMMTMLGLLFGTLLLLRLLLAFVAVEQTHDASGFLSGIVMRIVMFRFLLALVLKFLGFFVVMMLVCFVPSASGASSECGVTAIVVLRILRASDAGRVGRVLLVVVVLLCLVRCSTCSSAKSGIAAQVMVIVASTSGTGVPSANGRVIGQSA